jgi:hypothetical protein
MYICEGQVVSIMDSTISLVRVIEMTSHADRAVRPKVDVFLNGLCKPGTGVPTNTV